MHFTQLGGLAALAGLSQAFLLPPNLDAIKIKDATDALPFEAQILSEGRVVEVECPGCAVAHDSNGQTFRADSKLRLHLAISHTPEQDDALNINGIQVYPVNRAAISKGLHAEQLVREQPGGLTQINPNPELGYTLGVKPYHNENEASDLSLFSITFHVIEIANDFHRGIPAIELKLIRTPSGKLVIVDSHVSHRPSHNTLEPSPNCTTLLCRWKAILASKVDGVKKGCSGRKKFGAGRLPRPHGIKVDGGRPRPDGFRQSHPHPSGRPHHRRPHHRGSLARFVHTLAVHVVIPMAVGLAVGMLASVIGMIVGHFVVFLWRLLFRRGERGQCANRRAVEEGVEEECDDETKGFLQAQGPPPVYEDAPVYEEAILDEKTEQK